jgi:hypothetical protein
MTSTSTTRINHAVVLLLREWKFRGTSVDEKGNVSFHFQTEKPQEEITTDLAMAESLDFTIHVRTWVQNQRFLLNKLKEATQSVRERS